MFTCASDEDILVRIGGDTWYEEPIQGTYSNPKETRISVIEITFVKLHRDNGSDG